VAKVSELSPGQMKMVVADRERLLLVNMAGLFYAISDEWVVYLQPAAKYKRPAWRPSPGQKGADHRALRVSQWSSAP